MKISIRVLMLNAAIFCADVALAVVIADRNPAGLAYRALISMGFLGLSAGVTIPLMIHATIFGVKE